MGHRQQGCEVETAVEAIAELVEVARQMLATGLVVSATQAVLNGPEHGVEQLELKGRHAVVAAASHDRLMLKSGTRDAAEAGQTITEDDGIGVEVPLGEALDFRLAKAFDLAEAKSDRVVVLVA